MPSKPDTRQPTCRVATADPGPRADCCEARVPGTARSFRIRKQRAHHEERPPGNGIQESPPAATGGWGGRILPHNSATYPGVVADELTLAADFPTPTREEWLAAVDKALRGADFERKLVSATDDGIRIEPLYTADDAATAHDEAGFPGFTPLIRGSELAPRSGGVWDIRTRVAHPDPATANEQILADLLNGATSVELVIDAAGTGEGISCRDQADLARALQGVVLDAAPISLRAGAHGAVAAAWLAGIAGETPVAGSLGLDPIGALLTAGELPQGLDKALADLDRTAPPHLRIAVASGAAVADAGASEAQEIGYILATATTYLRSLAEHRGTREAARRITLEVTADVDLFATIAKLRALRHAWATVLTGSGLTLDPGLVQITAVSSSRTWTVTDPWVNLLRGTAATLGAVIGGADGVTLEAFDAAAGLPGELGRRMARNTQLVLQDESGIGRVLDPAGGSWFVESLTDELARTGWEYFQQLEAAGGPIAGLPQFREQIAEVAARRERKVATRKRPITGTSEFPLLDEQRPEPVAAPEPDPRPGVPLAGEPTTIDPLPRHRLSEPYEALRERDGTVFLANLGPIAVHTARATFAKNLFAAGGIRTVGTNGASSPEEAATAFAESGATVACICSSDDVYAEQAAATATALKEAGARRVYLAGKGDYEGVDETVGLGVDVLDVLTRLHDELEA